MTLYIPVGPPGCGKSTLARKMVQAQIITPDAVISSDATRKLITGDQTNQDCTSVAFKIIDLIIDYRLSNNLDVYMDATNLTVKPRRLLIELAQKLEQEIVIYLTYLSNHTILARNNSGHRQKKGTVVPDHAMEKMFARLDQASFKGSEYAGITVIQMEDMHEELDDILFDEYYGVNDYDED